MTYKDAYDKIIQAYFKDEIKPMNKHFCFCGTLGVEWWTGSGDYRIAEYQRMEFALLSEMGVVGIFRAGPSVCQFISTGDPSKHPKYEDTLFNGMCAALEVLKEIHRSRGENVDEVKLTKRVLTT